MEHPEKANAEDEVQKESAEASADAESSMSALAQMLQQSLNLSEKKHEKVLPQLTVDGVVEYIKSGKARKIITMAGAGISTSAGIPDFRSPGTGLYDNLQKYNLPSPQAIFELAFFKTSPEPFFHLARELWPGLFKPTPCHYFLRLLNEKGVLLRHYTQNIDTLERVAGLESEKMVEAHGTFHTAHCLTCSHEYSQQWIKERIFSEKVPHCTEKDCDGLVKPDIIFFGEQLPKRFFTCVAKDFAECDLLIILGTSLVVQPFASLISRVPDTTPRVYFNLEKPKTEADPIMRMLGMGHDFQFDLESNYRDIFCQGKCDDCCLDLADKLGWKTELADMIKQGHANIESSAEEDKSTDKSDKSLASKE